MKKHVFLVMLPAIIALSLLAAFIFVIPAFAQDEVPPFEIPPEEAPIEVPGEASAEIPAASADTEIPVGATGIPEEAPVVEEVPAEELAPVLEEAVEVGVALVDESGEPLALATEESAETLAGGDPWYKVGTTTYFFRFPGGCGVTLHCQESTTPINAALSNIVNTTGLPSDGFIYVEEDDYDDIIVIDGISDPVLSGLKGLIGAADPLSHEPLVNLNGIIRVQNCLKGFIIKGFNISYSTSYAEIYLYNCVGPIKIENVAVQNPWMIGYGIQITSQNGPVTINNAKVDGSAVGGAIIDNTLGTTGVTITNSSFSNNDSDLVAHVGGLTIATRGSININGVTAFGNTGGEPGLFIRQSGAITIKNSVISNNTGYGLSNDYTISTIVPTSSISLSNVIANGNAGGIRLFTKGNISLANVTVNLNKYDDGVYLDTCHEVGGVCEWLGSGAVSIKNSVISENDSLDAAIWIIARGSITLTNVDASRNSDGVSTDGAKLINRYSPSMMPVKVTSSTFNENCNLGILIQSTGAVTLTRITATHNGHPGVSINNSYLSKPGVSISGTSLDYNQLNANESGLIINSNGTISIKYTNANSNQYWGALVNNNNTNSTAGVTISSSSFIDNNWTNLTVSSFGAIKLSSVEASFSHQEYGAYLENQNSLYSPAVTITNSRFSNNYLEGLVIKSKGAVSINGGNADGNSSYGVDINNFYASSASPKPVSIKNFQANGNTDIGIYVLSKGTISLSMLIVNNTGGSTYAGIALNNVGFTGNIILNKIDASGNVYKGIDIITDGSLKYNSGVVTKNGYDGIFFAADGAASISNVISNNNGNNGLSVYSLSNVTLSNVKSSGNGNDGVYINAAGAIKLSSIAGDDNGHCGVEMDNTSSTTFAGITIAGSAGANGFSGNVNYGLRISSLGTVSLKNITINDNGYGLYLDNYRTGWGKGYVSFSYINIHNSGVQGMYITTNGITSLKYVTSMFNQAHGIYVDSHDHNVTILNSVSIANRFTGITVEVGTGIFTISNTLFYGNDIDNTGDHNLVVIH